LSITAAHAAGAATAERPNIPLSSGFGNQIGYGWIRKPGEVLWLERIAFDRLSRSPTGITGLNQARPGFE